MPYADPKAQKAAQREWYEREREKTAQGIVKPAPPEPVPVPSDLRGAPKVISQIRANTKAARQVARRYEQVQRLPFMSRARREEQAKLDKLPGVPHSDVPTVRVSPELERRVLLILTGLIRGAESQGWSVSAAADGLSLRIDDEEIAVRWREELKQVKVEEDEIFRSWRSHRTELHPKGTLEFTIEGRRVRDGKRWQVEDRLAHMLQLAQEAVHERRRVQWERAAQQQRWREDERKIALMHEAAAARRLREEKEQARRDRVVAMALDWNQAANVRSFAHELRRIGDPEAVAWARTADEVAEALDPLASPLPAWRIDAEGPDPRSAPASA